MRVETAWEQRDHCAAGSLCYGIRVPGERAGRPRFTSLQIPDPEFPRARSNSVWHDTVGTVGEKDLRVSGEGDRYGLPGAFTGQFADQRALVVPNTDCVPGAAGCDAGG